LTAFFAASRQVAPELKVLNRRAFIAQQSGVVAAPAGGGEAVVQFDEADVLGPTPGLRVGCLARFARAGVDVAELAALLHGSVSARGGDLHARSCCALESVRSFLSITTDRGGRAVGVGRAHRPRVG